MINVQFNWDGIDDLSLDVQMPYEQWLDVRARAVKLVNEQIVKHKAIDAEWPYRLVIEPNYVALETTYGLDPVLDDPSDDESWRGLVYVSTEFPQNKPDDVNVDELIEQFMSQEPQVEKT